VFSANGRQNIEVLFDVDPTLPEVVGRRKCASQQVLINLYGNVIRSLPLAVAGHK
jgi:nitrogen-specific signal transduction histidine kinase